MPRDVVLDVRDLVVDYVTAAGPVRAVDQVSFVVERGEFVGLAGESGSGKSTLVHAILRTLGPPGVIRGGAVELCGADVLALDAEALRQLRFERVAIVFQSALNALNPVATVSAQIVDTLRAHRPWSRREARARVGPLLQRVGIDPSRAGAYPHELSGGMRQRVVIAIALALEPELLILDEPTTALDVVVEREIFKMLADLKREMGFSVLLITHDLPLMLEVAGRVGVMKGGRLVELAATSDIAHRPQHPYTAHLMQAFLSVDG